MPPTHSMPPTNAIAATANNFVLNRFVSNTNNNNNHVPLQMVAISNNNNQHVQLPTMNTLSNNMYCSSIQQQQQNTLTLPPLYGGSTTNANYAAQTRYNAYNRDQ